MVIFLLQATWLIYCLYCFSPVKFTSSKINLHPGINEAYKIASLFLLMYLSFSKLHLLDTVAGLLDLSLLYHSWLCGVFLLITWYIAWLLFRIYATEVGILCFAPYYGKAAFVTEKHVQQKLLCSCFTCFAFRCRNLHLPPLSSSSGQAWKPLCDQ